MRRPASPSARARVAGVVLGMGVWALIGTTWAAVVGGVVAAVVPPVVERLEPREHRRRREALESAAADVAEVLALIVQAGGSLERALEVTAASCDGPAREELQRTRAALERGAGAQAWIDLGVRVPCWSSLTAPLARAVMTGAPVAAVLTARAEAMRRQRRDAVLARARGLGIRATVPMGLLLLPAFVLLAVVPLVASLAHALLGSL